MSNVKMSGYRNIFAEMGKSEAEIQAKLENAVREFFFGEDRVYFESGEDMGYMEDTGNHDARTEGMSYGMMMCVQMNMKEEFDRIWKWVKTYMYMDEGYNEGYFAWSCQTNGTKNAKGPAPDGEEFFAMALFFASHRWGDGEGMLNYSHEAKEILRACLHKGQNGREGTPMWNLENKQILFVPGVDYTDPSYHLPHFYELFAQWAYEEDRPFWAEAAKVSREYLVKACHPVTGMNSEYAEFDGSPMNRPIPWAQERHNWFFSDSYRTVANIGLDYEWCGQDVGQRAAAERLQYTLGVVNKENPYVIYEVDGTRIEEEARHPVGLMATTAQGALAIDGPITLDSADPVVAQAAQWVERLWNEPLRKGDRRYYDNCLYIFALLALSGNYRAY
ncbi:MAG: xylanase [Lachnospiraceae bacterium]|nr:xylanase [Lachnospiraceae bacterium]